MKIRLQELEELPFSWRESLSLSAESVERPELLELTEVKCEGQLDSAGEGYHLEARLSYQQTLACDRCLKPIVQPVVSRFELAVLPGSAEPMTGEHELDAADLQSYYLEGEVLDTRPLLLEQLELNIPMKPLCREDCAGLCPICGENRNETSCRCEDQDVDPRWLALRNLRSATDEGKRG